MHRRSQNILLLWLLLVGSVQTASSAGAARGGPGSAEFGIGAIVYPGGPFLQEALSMAVDLQLDWVQVPVDWSDYQSQVDLPPRLEELDALMGFAAEHGIAIVVSLHHPPAWAQTPTGPDPRQTVALVSQLVQRFPAAIQAIELFPGANTSAGWGSEPNPAAYLALYGAVQDTLRSANHPALLIAAGLQPIAPGTAGAINDMDFLQALYDGGGAQRIEVLSLQYPQLAGDLLRMPQAAEPRVLRRYEDIRRLMLANHHGSAKIWITYFRPPSSTIAVHDSADQSNEEDAAWLTQAHMQLRSQLSIGVVFLLSLNTEREVSGEATPSLINGQAQIHPFYETLQSLVELNHSGSLNSGPGQPKDGNFEKNRP